jgi:hypothetical protein
MILFRSEESLEEREFPPNSADSPLISTIIARTEEKFCEPLHRNKKLRIWPGDTFRKQVYRKVATQETGLPPTKESLEDWKRDNAEGLWLRLTEGLDQDTKNRILREYSIGYISSLVTNTIHLENLYTSLKPIGNKQWEVATQKLKSMASEEYILSLTEKPELLFKDSAKRVVPEWVKGAIIYLSLQGSKAGREMLNPNTRTTPELEALRTATNWALGNHLKVGETQKDIEQTAELFKKWTKKRKEIKLELVRIDMEEIPEEISVPPPKLQDQEMPWTLAWKILPILEMEIRHLAEGILKNENYLATISQVYKKKIFDRWVSNLGRRSYLRKQSEVQGVADRWKTRTLVLNPIDNYISQRIKADCPDIRLMAKTEAAWLMLTDNLPEPELT